MLNGWTLHLTADEHQTFEPDNSPISFTGDHETSTVTVQNLKGVLTDVDVSLSFEIDEIQTPTYTLEIFLIGPTGNRIQLFAGDQDKGSTFSGARFDDDAARQISSLGETSPFEFETYMLTIAGTGEDGGTTGDLDIRDETRIVGLSGSETTIIDANQVDRILDVIALPNSNLMLEAVTITGGSAIGGGGLRNASLANILDSTIFSNTSLTNGGGITNAGGGTLLLEGSAVVGNMSVRHGGGIENDGDLNIRLSSISQNATGNGTSHSETHGGSGGGIYNAGTLNTDFTAIEANVTGSGFDSFNGSTNAGNGGNGGAIYNDGTALILTSTLALNQTGDGGSRSGPDQGLSGGDGGSGAGVYNSTNGTLVPCKPARSPQTQREWVRPVTRAAATEMGVLEAEY